MAKKLGAYTLHDSDDDDSSGAGSAYNGNWGDGGIDLTSWTAGLSGGKAKPGGPPGHGGGGGGGGSGGGTGLLTSYTSGNPLVDDHNEFNVKIIFSGGNWTTSLQHDLIVAADALSKYITGDIPDYAGVDDISITASVVVIDGPGRILGQAGPTGERPADGSATAYLPYNAIMQFDVADATNYDNAGLMDDIDLHEMMHSIGFGTVWDVKNLIAGAGTATPTFTGTNATDAYHAAGGLDLNPRIEDGGGSGTALSHWDEQTFTNELMTGYINNPNYLSYMTVASLADIGYSVVDSGGFTQPTFIG